MVEGTKALLHEKEKDGRMETDACSHWGSNQGMIMPRLRIVGENGEVSDLSCQKQNNSSSFPAFIEFKTPEQ